MMGKKKNILITIFQLILAFSGIGEMIELNIHEREYIKYDQQDKIKKYLIDTNLYQTNDFEYIVNRLQKAQIITRINNRTRNSIESIIFDLKHKDDMEGNINRS